MSYEHWVSFTGKGPGNAQGQGRLHAGNPFQSLGESFTHLISLFCVLTGSLAQKPMASRALLSEQERFSDGKYI